VGAGRRRRGGGAGGGGAGERTLAGAVARGVEGDDAERVGGPAGKPGEAVVGLRRRVDLAAVQVDVVAGNTDVVARGAPGERDPARRRRRQRQVRGSARRAGVGAGGGGARWRARAGAVARGGGGDGAERVAGPGGRTGVAVVGRRRRVDLAAASVVVVAGD